jgi:hypothetical protein
MQVSLAVLLSNGGSIDRPRKEVVTLKDIPHDSACRVVGEDIDVVHQSAAWAQKGLERGASGILDLLIVLELTTAHTVN